MDEIDREAFEERAAIMEFDGSLPRGEAERMAAQALLARADATCDKGDGDIEPPFTPTVRQPFAPLSASEEAAIRTWLALIEEIDPATIAEVIEHCQRDSEARSYFTRRAAFDLLNAGFVTDAARFHQKQ